MSFHKPSHICKYDIKKVLAFVSLSRAAHAIITSVALCQIIKLYSSVRNRLCYVYGTDTVYTTVYDTNTTINLESMRLNDKQVKEASVKHKRR